MKKVAIYVRVSTARQDQEGYSIPLQKERLIAYCKAKGWVVAGLFVDPGHCRVLSRKTRASRL